MSYAIKYLSKRAVYQNQRCLHLWTR